MEQQQSEYLQKFEQTLAESLTKYASERKLLGGYLFTVEELDETWRSCAPDYMGDAVPQIADYPLAAIAWAAYFGIGAALMWDKETLKDQENAYLKLRDARGFDEMDEYITEVLLCLPLGSEGANKLEDLIRSTAERALSLIRKEQVEAQSVMAFHVFARTTKVMFDAGVAVQLRRMGYNYVKVNADVVN